jgi:uncharacterized membrane protein
MELKYNQDKGVAGLSLLLSVVVMLFTIGLLVGIFTIMGSEMRESTYTETTATVTGETVNATELIGSGYTLAGSLRGARSFSMVALYNNTDELLTSGNYTLTGAVLTNATALDGLTDVKANYTYTYDNDNTATDVMNDTYQSLTGVTSWFEIFIVISAMVVLILLTVIIITAIRGSGMIMNEGSTRDVGTA